MPASAKFVVKETEHEAGLGREGKLLMKLWDACRAYLARMVTGHAFLTTFRSFQDMFRCTSSRLGTEL